MNTKHHWEGVYSTKSEDGLSWHQDCPALSLRLIKEAAIPRIQGVLDVGGGTSPLAGRLVEAGFSPVAVLDVSAAALENAKRRSGCRASAIEWIEGDVTAFVPGRTYGLWHDRAVLHFLTGEADRRKYKDALEQAVTVGGHVILATFSLDGPRQCSGLPVRRYDAALMSSELGDRFELLREARETHLTPWGSEQEFNYFHFRKTA